MKTSVKRIKELDFSQPVVIDKISSTSAIVSMKYKSTQPIQHEVRKTSDQKLMKMY